MYTLDGDVNLYVEFEWIPGMFVLFKHYYRYLFRIFGSDIWNVTGDINTILSNIPYPHTFVLQGRPIYTCALLRCRFQVIDMGKEIGNTNASDLKGMLVGIAQLWLIQKMDIMHAFMFPITKRRNKRVWSSKQIFSKNNN